MFSVQFLLVLISVVTVILAALLVLFCSMHSIGQTEVGLVTKKWSKSKLPDDNPVALNGEAGYQADLLMPGLRFKLWPLYKVEKFPWVQVPAGEIGVVISQIGTSLPIGAKSAIYKNEFGNFSNLRDFLTKGGQKGVQRPVLVPGTLAPIHPIGFLVITSGAVFGTPIDPQLQDKTLTCKSFGLLEDQLKLVRIEPTKDNEGKTVDMIGIVTTLDGDPLPSGDIANRLGIFEDVEQMEKAFSTTSDKETSLADQKIIEVLLGSKNNLHNNYQDFQKFIEAGGKIGLQHDPLLYGAFALNPFLVKVERVPMLVVRQGEVAVIRSYVGLPTRDTSGEKFKYGSLVRAGHRGIWQEPLRTGKFALNPRCYAYEIVPTAILTLNWAQAVSQAHQLDKNLSQIKAKSKEGFEFAIDLQVQIHVADTKAPRVITAVGTMFNLVNEVLQAAVGNHFRDKLQSMQAINFIEKRQEVQKEAQDHVEQHLSKYEVETVGVYIQDVVFPSELVEVLKEREIATQRIETFKQEKKAEDQRIDMEAAKGRADMQSQLAKSEVEITIKTNQATARKAEADGEATYVEMTGKAKGAEIEAVGIARAKSYEAQVKALGQDATALVNVTTALADKNIKIVPDVLVGNGGSGIEGLMGMMLRSLNNGNGFNGNAKETESVKS